MANASKNSIGPGAQGKQSGTGAMTDLPDGILPENMVLSNRDKSRHTDERGLDSKYVQTEQYQDHAGNRLDARAAGEQDRPGIYSNAYLRPFGNVRVDDEPDNPQVILFRD